MIGAAGLAVLGVHVGNRNSRSHPARLGLDPDGWWLSVGPKLSDHVILCYPLSSYTTIFPRQLSLRKGSRSKP